MKMLLIVANLTAAIVLYFLGCAAIAAHRSHAFSVYQELKTRDVLKERPDYNVEERLKTIANGGRYSLWISEIGAAAFILNAILIAGLPSKGKAAKPETP